MFWQQYTSLGISVIPIKRGTKQPDFKRLFAGGWEHEGKSMWSPATKCIAKESLLHTWFDSPGAGIALVGGEVSGNLIYLDFDNRDAYAAWARQHLGLIRQTAVNRTANGYHVLFRLVKPHEAESTGLWVDKVKVGDIKGENGYVCCSPTVHPTGCLYEWVQHPKDGILVVPSVADLGVERAANNGQRSQQEQTFQSERVGMSRQALIARICLSSQGATFERLNAGNWRGYGSQSEADLAFCRILAFWFGRDVNRMDRVFRESGLMREKWDRLVTQGLTYGERTISKACVSADNIFQPKRQNKWVTL